MNDAADGSGYWDYVAYVTACARQHAVDRLSVAVAERLTGRLPDGVPAEAVRRSPPLGRDDPDPSFVLMNVFDDLKRAAQAAGADAEADRHAVHRFRKVLVGLIVDNLGDGGDRDLFERAADLAAYCGVAEDEALAARLRRGLWGFLESELSQPFEHCPFLDGEEGACARSVFDLWLSLIDPDAVNAGRITIRRHQRYLLFGIFERVVKGMKDQGVPGGGGPSADLFYWLMLLFRALMKLAPEQAAAYGLPALAEAETHATRCDAAGTGGRLVDELHAMMWEYAQVFEANEAWARRFFAGVRGGAARGAFEHLLKPHLEERALAGWAAVEATFGDRPGERPEKPRPARPMRPMSPGILTAGRGAPRPGAMAGAGAHT